MIPAHETRALWGLCADGGLLCPACCRGENGSLASFAHDPSYPDLAQWRLVQLCEVCPATRCAHCGALSPDAYLHAETRS